MTRTEGGRGERHIHEECGVFGIQTPQTADVASYAYYALYALQHRGQESAGRRRSVPGLRRPEEEAVLVEPLQKRCIVLKDRQEPSYAP